MFENYFSKNFEELVHSQLSFSLALAGILLLVTYNVLIKIDAFKKEKRFAFIIAIIISLMAFYYIELASELIISFNMVILLLVIAIGIVFFLKPFLRFLKHNL